MRVCFWTSGRLEVDDRVVLDRAREGKFYGATCLFVIFWTESLVVLATGVRRVVGTDVDEIVSTVTLGGNAGLRLCCFLLFSPLQYKVCLLGTASICFATAAGMSASTRI